ncbi:MAG: S8 family serine peptidase, partial [Bifidobacteriaceae bacterium]|jgi:hypothetical protein|nr:S8 family serine peptidase [Bifidobacteriaceae bacterium]
VLAIPRAGTSPGRIAAQVRTLAGARLARNAADDDGGGLVVVDVASPDAAWQMVASGLYRAVDYDVAKRLLDYTNTPDDPKFQENGAWGLKDFPGARFDAVWADLAGAAPGSAAPVAVLDTGFHLAHEDRGPNILDGRDFTSGKPTADSRFPHGTATGGLIGAATDNGIGIAAAAPTTTVMPYKVSPDGQWITLAASVEAMGAAVESGAKVISMSYGGPPTSVERAAVAQAVADGVVLVAAAGNGGSGDVGYPAAYAGVISVGAIGATGAPASFTSTNRHVDIAAPGVGIGVMEPGGYGSADGTSFACPMVAAAASLVLRVQPGLTADQVEGILTSTAVDSTGRTTTGREGDATGHGRLDVAAAVAKARTVAPVGIDPAAPRVRVGAGQEFSMELDLHGGDQVRVAGGAPGGVAVTQTGGQWTLGGAPTAAGTHAVDLELLAGGVPVATRTVTVIVEAGSIAEFSVTPSVQAMVNTGSVGAAVAGADAFGNPIPDVVGASSVTTQPEDCRFTSGEAPSRRPCAIAAQYSGAHGVAEAEASVDVFDPSGLVPVIAGKAVPGGLLTAAAPAGWPDLEFAWLRSDGSTARSGPALTVPAGSVGDFFLVQATLTHLGLTLTGSSRSVWIAAAPAATAPAGGGDGGQTTPTAPAMTLFNARITAGQRAQVTVTGEDLSGVVTVRWGTGPGQAVTAVVGGGTTRILVLPKLAAGKYSLSAIHANADGAAQAGAKTLTVTKVKPKVKVKVGATTVKATVKATGLAKPTGAIRFKSGKTKLTVKLKAAAKGTVQVKRSRLPRAGRLTVAYLGSASIAGKTATARL